jgi:bidirectional [NiFe] hydrogenase diaphorase subunit
MIKLTIDNKVVEVEAGVSVLNAASQAGIDIPTLCYHESLTPQGACRLCVVEVKTNGKWDLTTSCNFPVVPGLEVRTSTDRVTEARKLAVELLLAQRPHSTRIWDLAKKLGVEQPSFTLKQRECILCELCERACNELVGARAITFIAQEKGRNIEQPSVEHSEDKCVGCGSCAYACPTEAITLNDVGDTRTLSTPSGKLEFKLKKCKVCGRYWATEKELKFIIDTWHLEPDLFDTCPDCRG